MLRKRVLIIDDVDFNIEFEEKIIQTLAEEEKLEITVDTAHTVQGAKEKILQNRPYDAMVIDMNLPDGSGVEIAHAAYEKSDETRLAALTIYPSKYEDQRPFFDIFLRKPIIPSDYKQNFGYLLRLD
jgi:CheY-like chemotaxis protein